MRWPWSGIRWKNICCSTTICGSGRPLFRHYQITCDGQPPWPFAEIIHRPASMASRNKKRKWIRRQLPDKKFFRVATDFRMQRQVRNLASKSVIALRTIFKPYRLWKYRHGIYIEKGDGSACSRDCHLSHGARIRLPFERQRNRLVLDFGIGVCSVADGQRRPVHRNRKRDPITTQGENRVADIVGESTPNVVI